MDASKLTRKPINEHEQKERDHKNSEIDEEEDYEDIYNKELRYYQERSVMHDEKMRYDDDDWDFHHKELYPVAELQRKRVISIQTSVGSTKCMHQNLLTQCELCKSSKTSDSHVKNISVWHSYSLHKFIIAIAVILIFSFLIFYYTRENKNIGENISIPELIKILRNKFGDQTNLTYKILQAALKRVVEPNPSAPAIISLLVDKGAYGTAIQFCNHLAQILALHENVVIDERMYKGYNHNEIKLKIDEEIRSKVVNKSLSMVIVDKFEEIPIAATMIFHSYCDHESALFKRVIYMFVLSLDTVLPTNADQKHLDKVAYKHFKKTWHTAADDFVDSLITRITVNVVNIK